MKATLHILGVLVALFFGSAVAIILAIRLAAVAAGVTVGDDGRIAIFIVSLLASGVVAGIVTYNYAENLDRHGNR